MATTLVKVRSCIWGLCIFTHPINTKFCCFIWEKWFRDDKGEKLKLNSCLVLPATLILVLYIQAYFSNRPYWMGRHNSQLISRGPLIRFWINNTDIVQYGFLFRMAMADNPILSRHPLGVIRGYWTLIPRICLPMRQLSMTSIPFVSSEFT